MVVGARFDSLKAAFAFAVLGLYPLCAPAPCAAEEIAPQAQRMIAIIDALGVEEHWPAGQHVHWESGKPYG